MKSKVNVSLSKDLRKKYGIRSFAVVKGDIVTVKSGGKKSEGGKVIDVDRVSGKISIEGITIAKADGKQKEYYLDPRNIRITRLDLSKPERLQRLKFLAGQKNIQVEDVPEPIDTTATESSPVLEEQNASEEEQKVSGEETENEESEEDDHSLTLEDLDEKDSEEETDDNKN
ncbi:50S ribosomal protein L24 [Oxyplasma meridianum]|uniref:50S ribosomal protein L24 n=1 Tax=Oxyplasma meridianum TaxID=3073602 RepID=A0AAX4NGX6_9ARCH